MPMKENAYPRSLDGSHSCAAAAVAAAVAAAGAKRATTSSLVTATFVPDIKIFRWEKRYAFDFVYPFYAVFMLVVHV